jgi:hypothetical protein
MRKLALLSVVALCLSASGVVSAQPEEGIPDDPSDDANSSDATPPSEAPEAEAPPEPSPEPPSPEPPSPEARPALSPKTPAVEEAEPVDTRPRTLAPRFAEDRYPGDGIPSSTELQLTSPGDGAPTFGVALHGYFRAPFRFSRVEREAEDVGEGESKHNYRTPFLLDDDYYVSGFSYLPVNQRPWNETYLSVGNERLTATVGLMSAQFSDSEAEDYSSQFGVAQGWLTYRFRPADWMKVQVKGGSFWDRFGYLPKYDTYIFGRTHQVGAQAKVEVETGPLTFWVLDGVGGHTESIKSKQGLTMLHYAQAGVSYDRMVELGLYYLHAQSRDKRSMQDIEDGSMGVMGVDLRLHTPVAKLYAAFSSISADKVLYLAPALEVMHSYGRLLMDNYLGTEQGSEKGTGGLKNYAFQLDFSVADSYRGFTQSKSSPLPWNGDIVASAFGVMTQVDSKQVSEDPFENKDGITKWKWGFEGGWRATEWAGVFLRYDRVIPDVNDSASSFRVLSPRVALFTHFLSQEQIYFQYSNYAYKERVRLRPGQVANEEFPDEDVFKIQAEISY